mmetsp:Transcript_23630/g.67769  ORF Transcript_23630/g.67769 Transcript_23630/m.67769 type:complete len:394 (-) Transcript_23630:845-2026(-)
MHPGLQGHLRHRIQAARRRLRLPRARDVGQQVPRQSRHGLRRAHDAGLAICRGIDVAGHLLVGRGRRRPGRHLPRGGRGQQPARGQRHRGGRRAPRGGRLVRHRRVGDRSLRHGPGLGRFFFVLQRHEALHHGHGDPRSLGAAPRDGEHQRAIGQRRSARQLERHPRRRGRRAAGDVAVRLADVVGEAVDPGGFRHGDHLGPPDVELVLYALRLPGRHRDLFREAGLAAVLDDPFADACAAGGAPPGPAGAAAELRRRSVVRVAVDGQDVGRRNALGDLRRSLGRPARRSGVASRHGLVDARVLRRGRALGCLAPPQRRHGVHVMQYVQPGWCHDRLLGPLLQERADCRRRRSAAERLRVQHHGCGDRYAMHRRLPGHLRGRVPAIGHRLPVH